MRCVRGRSTGGMHAVGQQYGAAQFSRGSGAASSTAAQSIRSAPPVAMPAETQKRRGWCQQSAVRADQHKQHERACLASLAARCADFWGARRREIAAERACAGGSGIWVPVFREEPSHRSPESAADAAPSGAASIRPLFQKKPEPRYCTIVSIELFDPRPALGLRPSVDYLLRTFCAFALAFSAPCGLDSLFL